MTTALTPSLATAGPTFEMVAPAPRMVWRSLVEQQGRTPIESTPEWMECIEAAGRHVDASRLYRFGDGRAVVVPLATSRHGGRMAPVSSLPFDWGFGGITSGCSVLAPDEIDAVLRDLAGLPALRVRLAVSPDRAPGWVAAASGLFPVIEERTVQVLDLSPGLEKVLAGYSTNRRKSVRRAERRGVEVEVDRTGRRLGVFFDLYEKSIERWAREQNEPVVLCRYRNHRANSRAKIATVARLLGDRCAVWTAWVEGRPAAASIVLQNGPHLTGWKSVADIHEFGSTGAVDLLKTAIITDGCSAGATVYDLGESRPGSNLAKFKAAYGAREHVLHIVERERLPLRRVQGLARTVVKRAVGFQDR